MHHRCCLAAWMSSAFSHFPGQAREPSSVSTPSVLTCFSRPTPRAPEKRHDLALALAGAVGVTLLTLGGVDPSEVPLWVNAANATLVPSEREGFGLAVLEALACDVPVLATPVGIHADALKDVDGTLCAPFDVARWRTALEPHLDERDPRVNGRASAMRYSAQQMASRVASAWRAALQSSG